MMKRYIIEFGTGIDFHGQDVTGAARKAVKDAISHACLCGSKVGPGLNDLEFCKIRILWNCMLK
ncbi:Lin0512 family protein [Desulfotruncus alcoholivorax]|uniref:Lin0512 family protein n=1 Tax=Desulfotruncus alcoholivorax TaxID=265477 RepID=UPI0003FC798C|nr:Lin0512 family protein [Desulfotruncus alcoholivorax]